MPHNEADKTHNSSEDSMSDAQRLHLKNLSEEAGAAAPADLSKEEASERIDELEEKGSTPQDDQPA